MSLLQPVELFLKAILSLSRLFRGLQVLGSIVEILQIDMCQK